VLKDKYKHVTRSTHGTVRIINHAVVGLSALSPRSFVMSY